MYNRIAGQSTRPDQADEPNPSMDSDSFAQALADLTQRQRSPSGEWSDQMGLCCGKPHTSDANVYGSVSSDPSTSSLSSSPNPSSPERPVRPLFQYRTAELPGANVNGICVGLAAEWLLSLQSSPSSRMRARWSRALKTTPQRQCGSSGMKISRLGCKIIGEVLTIFRQEAQCCAKQAWTHQTSRRDIGLAHLRALPR